MTGSTVDRGTSGELENKMATNNGKMSSCVQLTINCRQNTGREDTSKFIFNEYVAVKI